MNDYLLQPLLRAIAAGDDDAAEVAVSGLSALDGAALPQLMHLSCTGDLDQRWWSVRAVAELAEEHPDERDQAMPALLSALLDPEDSIRCVAALGLGQMLAPAFRNELPAETVDEGM